MRNDQIKLRLQIDVTYDAGSMRIARELKQGLIWAAEHLASEGLLSGDTEATVERWESSVDELYDDRHEKDEIRCGKSPYSGQEPLSDVINRVF